MPYSYVEWLQGFFIVHSIIGSTVHSMPLNSLKYCICTTTMTNIRPDRDSNLVHPGCKPQSIRMSHRSRPLKHKTLVYHYYNVGATLSRRCTDVIQIPCVCRGYVLSVCDYIFEILSNSATLHNNNQEVYITLFVFTHISTEHDGNSTLINLLYLFSKSLHKYTIWQNFKYHTFCPTYYRTFNTQQTRDIHPT